MECRSWSELSGTRRSERDSEQCRGQHDSREGFSRTSTFAFAAVVAVFPRAFPVPMRARLDHPVHVAIVAPPSAAPTSFTGFASVYGEFRRADHRRWTAVKHLPARNRPKDIFQLRKLLGQITTACGRAAPAVRRAGRIAYWRCRSRPCRRAWPCTVESS